MFVKIVFSIACLVMFILLIIAYRSKDNGHTLSVKIYNYMLNTGVFFIVSEILEVYIWTYCDSKLLFDISLKLHWTTFYIIIALLYFYVMLPIKKLNYNKIIDILKNDKKELFVLLTIVVWYIISLFIKIPEMTEETFTFIPGLYAYFSISLMIIIGILIVTNMVKNKDYNVRIKRAMFFCFVSICTIFIFQFIFPKTVLFSMIIVWSLIVLYFNVENPDLKMIIETDNMKELAEKSSRLKTDFLSNMSNDVKIPINNIIGYCNYLLYQEQLDNNTLLENVNTIKVSSNNLLNTINNTIDISKIETGTESLYENEYYLKDLIFDLYNTVILMLESKKLVFNISVDENLPSKYYGDKNKIFQILLNFLTNSIKYTEVGKIDFIIAGEHKDDKLLLKCKVADTGIGIKKEDHEKVFKKFSKIDSSVQREAEGIGIGLVLNKKFAELMNGNIWFESDYGVGSNFYLEVPQKIVNDNKIGNINDIISTSINNNMIDCSGKKALIVDDDTLSLIVTKRLLSYYKFDIETMNSANECLYKIKNGSEYNIIFLDHILKDFDGVELTKTLKKMEGYKIPPIVILTANVIEGIREYYIQNGADNYLPKPIDLNALDRVINLYFNKQ